MKQSGNNFGRKTKNEPNLKDSLPGDDQKLIEAKSSLSGPSEQESDSNEDGFKNRGF